MERRNLLYGIILAVLCITIVTVVVLILRRQAAVPVAPITQTRTVTAPAGTIPLKDTKFERPWKKGDPEPVPEPVTEVEIPETETMKTF